MLSTIYLPNHIATSTECILALAKAYIEGIADFLHQEHIGLRLSRNCLVRLHGKYFIVRKRTIDLNVISPLSESWEIKTIKSYVKRLRSLEPNKTLVFIDVGSHIGKYTLLLSDIVDRVIALEPDPRNYKLLLYNLKLNNINNVIPLQIAASSKKG